MHQTFTGSSRRPRQVNLSGRKGNPFAAVGTTSSNSQSAVAKAQAERERRHQEQHRDRASRTIQRYWRGYTVRRVQKENWRRKWDEVESRSSNQEYRSDAEAFDQLVWLLRFASPSKTKDIERLRRWFGRCSTSKQISHSISSGPWPLAYLRLQKLLLVIIDRLTRKQTKYDGDVQFLFDGLIFTIQQSPELSADNIRSIYHTLANTIRALSNSQGNIITQLQAITECALTPLRTIAANTISTYEAFACQLLILPELSKPPFSPHCLDKLADGVNYKLLANAIAGLLRNTNHSKYPALKDQSSQTYLLAYLIYIYRVFHKSQQSDYSNDKDYLFVVSTLLSSVDTTLLRKPDDFEDDIDAETDFVGEFLRDQVLSLVDGDNISRLLGTNSTLPTNGHLDDDAKHLASFALTLLRFFPKKADEIRIRLYRSSGKSTYSQSIPAIRYFWEATKNTLVFKSIQGDIDSVIPLLRPKSTNTQNEQHTSFSKERVEDQWRIILVFFELYSFVLRLMDDEEFFSAESIDSTLTSNWASQNALPLEDIKSLTLFLKNLGFSMVFNAFMLQNLEEEKPRDVGSISNYFSLSSNHIPSEPTRQPESTVAGITGISTDYVKETVTGLLRMLYERDSRRPFLPKGHWLMTSRLDMDSFIGAVVDEDEKRHQIQEDDFEPMDEDSWSERDTLVGTGHSSRLRQQEQLRQQQRKHARTRFLAAVAPRLEILQNMPFFIPFETRVQIFREFIKLDQQKRRGIHTDPDLWRHGIMPDQLRRHHARIHREHIFEDAQEQFYNLGEGLKEPIQITFVDAFGQEEAGIDGGGVTKEFLDSITKEAFKTNTNASMFVENDNHLLYPNPAAIDEIKETSGQLFGETSQETRQAVGKLLESYEFLGRIIGKCLYEGILIDVNFAGFFLLKWALTGGDGFTGRESNYRANLNDLRDLDEALYQGLLKLKNYPGDVSDFGQDFTIVDTITTNHQSGTTKNIERPLRPNGANIPVTNENRLVYISYVARYRLQERPFKQTSAFLRGLSTLINPSWLSMFNQSELQTLIGGTSSSINIPDLRSNTSYGGVYVIGDDGLEHPTVQLFWDTMTEFSDSDRRSVLKFITSTPNAPLLGFGSLMPRFSIRDSGNDQTRLPSTSTCVNLLKLPMYRDKELLRRKLLQAVHSGAGFDLS